MILVKNINDNNFIKVGCVNIKVINNEIIKKIESNA